MMNLFGNPAIVLLLTVGGLCLGFLVGFLLRGVFKREPKKEAEPEMPKVKPANRNWDEVAQLWRDRRDSRLLFQIGNQVYKRGTDLTPKEKKILLKVVMDFYQWLEPTSAIRPKVEEAATISEAAPAPDPAATVVDSVPLGNYNEPKSEPKRASFSPVQMISQALESDVKKSALPVQSMVVQIDAILQEKLHAADMQKWAVRLVEFPNRGMVVMVGLEQYDGIDAVPYERVRNMIREAVAEWERRSERDRSE